MQIISLINHKGGVGKTTTTATLASIFASEGKKVLMVDLDAQANLTYSFAPTEYERTIYDALRERRNLPIYSIGNNLDIVPSTLDLAGIELQIAGEISREYILKELLGAVEARYDYILLDCSQSLGLLTVNALTAATKILVPITAEALPVKGLQGLEDTVEMVRRRLNPNASIDCIVVCRYEARKKANKLILEELRKGYGQKVCETVIRSNTAITEAPLLGKTVVATSPASPGAEDYTNLARELQRRWE